MYQSKYLTMTREKKFLSPVLKDYAGNIAERWRVEWYIKHPDHLNGKRRVSYGNINSTKDPKERYRRARILISNILKEATEAKENLLTKVINLSKLEWRPKTICSYKTVVNLFSESYPVHEAIMPDQVREWLIQQKGLGKTNTTIKKYRDALCYLYNRAIKLELIKFNPVEVDIKIKKSPKSLLYFNDNQIEKFKHHNINQQLWLAIRLLFYCFIRPGEQRYMRISWINFEAGYIEIPGEYSKNKKTEKVSIPNQFLMEIEHLRHYPGQYFVLSKSGIPGPEMIAQNWLNNEHSKLLKQLCIVGRYAFYSWKHTGAVKAVKAGINIKDLQLQLRHHSLDMVNEYLKNLGVLDSEDLKKRFPVL